MCCTDCISSSTNFFLALSCAPCDESNKKKEAATLLCSIVITLVFLAATSVIGLSAANVISFPARLFGLQSPYLIATFLVAVALTSLSFAIACIRSWNKFSCEP